MAEFFAYAVDTRLAPFWLPFGLRPHKDGVTITDDDALAIAKATSSTPIEN